MFHINHYENQYENVFWVNVLFGVDITNDIQKLVQVLLNSCKISLLENVETAALVEFVNLLRRV